MVIHQVRKRFAACLASISIRLIRRSTTTTDSHSGIFILKHSSTGYRLSIDEDGSFSIRLNSHPDLTSHRTVIGHLNSQGKHNTY